MLNKEQIPSPEQEDILSPENELNLVLKAFEDENEQVVMDILNKYSSKDPGWSGEDKEKLKIKFEEIRKACESSTVPDAFKSITDFTLEMAENKL